MVMADVLDRLRVQIRVVQTHDDRLQMVQVISADEALLLQTTQDFVCRARAGNAAFLQYPGSCST